MITVFLWIHFWLPSPDLPKPPLQGKPAFALKQPYSY